MKFYARRLAFYVITLWAAISLNFFIPRLLPGNPADIILAKMARNGEIPPGVEKTVRLLLGAESDQSMWEQYLQYWGNLFRGNLGVSVTKYPTPVTELIGQALPWTIGLVGLATIISVLIGVGLGAWAGWKRGTWVDNLVPGSTLLQSLPYFWVALLLAYLFSVQWQILPRIGAYDVFTFDEPEQSWAFVLSVLKHGTLPALTIVISAFGGWMLGMRNMMVSTLAEDYITTAEAKGLRPRRIFMTYAVRNAALPSIAGFGVALGFVVAGSIVMEQVFTYPGIGKLMITAVQGNDYPLMQGVFLVITIAVLSANLLMDLVYGFIDPRARTRG
ncbi:peptide/nickel transport system permease protein [Salana multivorans]|uniref:Peptide/nickel transport system permease protein n=1 Tax=Salana multivorans TaxID=120377 RepID=A0A3N2DCV7_9MICO|nr:ABC transporter permease [Salana multivorans]MBN8880926.1 ABC transporter permease [Salana multivorans]OJX97985.1 MAG: peptide ABC transporter permease [Micrococcales bacterium 73-15]ROR97625.1 peptide/nickel transport system permease protein [Salana multivorans]